MGTDDMAVKTIENEPIMNWQKILRLQNKTTKTFYRLKMLSKEKIIIHNE